MAVVVVVVVVAPDLLVSEIWSKGPKQQDFERVEEGRRLVLRDGSALTASAFRTCPWLPAV